MKHGLECNMQVYGLGSRSLNGIQPLNNIPNSRYVNQNNVFRPCLLFL